MDPQVILWILGAIITVMTVVIGALAQAMLAHIRDDRDFRIEVTANNASMSTKLDRVIDDIGDHETGLRGQMHKMAQDISPYIISQQHKRGST